MDTRMLLALLLALPACETSPSGPVGDLWPTLPDARLLDQSPPDQTPDCPTPVGDAAGGAGWRVAWNAQVPLNDVSCVQGHVFIAGASGTLIHRPPSSSQCGGFARQKMPTQSDLLTVSFADLTYGVTAGRDPTIWETRDGGKTWTVAPQCGTVVFTAFHSLHLYSATKGYGAGNSDQGGAYKIYPGSSWICPDQTFSNQVLLGAFRLGDNGWFVGDTKGRIYHTPDEGSSWFYYDSGVSKPLHDVFVTAKGIGVTAGDEGVILRTEDGLAWSQVKTLGTDDLRGVHFVDDARGWIVGDNGSVLYSDDGGKSWTYQVAATTDRIEAVCFTSDNEGWAVTEAGDVLYTTTGGQ